MVQTPPWPVPSPPAPRQSLQDPPLQRQVRLLLLLLLPGGREAPPKRRLLPPPPPTAPAPAPPSRAAPPPGAEQPPPPKPAFPAADWTWHREKRREGGGLRAVQERSTPPLFRRRLCARDGVLRGSARGCRSERGCVAKKAWHWQRCFVKDRPLARASARPPAGPPARPFARLPAC